MPPQNVSKTKAVGIAGKDTVAAALAAIGSQRILAGDYVIGIACIGLAIGLYVIDQYI